MTIKELIKRLKTYPSDTIIKGVGMDDFGSERGDYSRCYIELEESATCTVEDLTNLTENNILDNVFEGYKGGEYTMREHTPILLSTHGQVGEHIIDIKECDGWIEFYSISAWEID